MVLRGPLVKKKVVPPVGAIHHPQLAERLERESAEGLDNELREISLGELFQRSLDFCGNVLMDNFKAVKEDHDFIKNWKPQ